MKHIVQKLTGLVTCMLSLCLLQAQTPDWVSLKTDRLGLDSATAFGLYVTDINNDLYPDIVAVYSSWSPALESPLRVYLNVSDASSGGNARRFVDITATSGVNVKPGGAVSRGTKVVALADINNDGKVDMVRGNHYDRLGNFTDQGDRCEVLLGDGLGHFSLVPQNGLHELGLLNTAGFSFLDYDKDGNIDLFIAPWFKDYEANVWDAGYLMKGNGDGTFSHVSAQAGITQQEPMYGCSVVDWNNDGWADIATSPYCRTGGQLWKNNGNGTFTNVAPSVGYNVHYMPGDNGQPLCMWNNVPEDYDNDGDMDFFFSLVHGGLGNNEGRSAIMLNGGASGNYHLMADRSLMTRKTPQSQHLGDYDASWLDMDNDGLMDLVMTQGHYGPNTDRLYVFRQDGDHHLTDVTRELGLLEEEQMNLHQVEVMDYDLDGDDDVLYCRQVSPRSMHVVENRIGQSGNWTGIVLRAPDGVNKSSIGARVYVWAGGIRRMREVYAGRGNGGGQQPFAMLFGLGGTGSIDSVRVEWPDAAGTVTTVVRPPANRYLEITGVGLAVAELRPEEANGEVFLYPNPAQDFLIIRWDGQVDTGRFDVYDMLGRKLPDDGRWRYTPGTGYYSLKDLAPGQYILRGVKIGGQVFSRIFVKGS